MNLLEVSIIDKGFEISWVIRGFKEHSYEKNALSFPYK